MNMQTRKYNNMMRNYNGFRGTQTVRDVKAGLPVELVPALTGAQLGLVLNAIDDAYHRGRDSTGASICDGDNMVWINQLNRGIEWKEVGAEYKEEKFPVFYDKEKEAKNEPYTYGTRSVKVKAGELVCKFTDPYPWAIEEKALS